MNASEAFVLLVFMTLIALLLGFLLLGVWAAIESGIQDRQREFEQRRRQTQFNYQMSHEFQVLQNRYYFRLSPPCYEEVADLGLPNYHEAIAMVPLYCLLIGDENE
jgi:hypothetical protein